MKPDLDIPRLPLARGLGLALSIRARMAPLCHRIEIAGSIRRKRPTVGDVDLVVEAMDRAALQARCAQVWTPVTMGEQNCIFTTALSGGGLLQIDIFFAHTADCDLLGGVTPANFGTLLLCRTGSKEHNIYLVERAKSLGRRWQPYVGVTEGDSVIASDSEEEIFKALDLPYVEPERRER